MMASSAKPVDRPLSGRHVLIAIIAFFGVMLIANAVFVTVALRSFPGVTHEDPYSRGLSYNALIDERAAQAALGWRAEISRVERNGDDVVIELRMSDGQGRALNRLSVDAVLKRPAYEHDDRAVIFTPAGAGVYQATLKAPLRGAWDLEAVALNDRDERLHIASRIMIP